jgi:hypothetical protein
MSSSERHLPLWWDRDVDAKTGNPLRTDVREAAHRVWKWVLRKSDEILGDGSEAAEVLENAVRAVSRYLNNKNIELNSSDPAGLLVLASSRLLWRAANKKRRIELVGSNNELAELLRAPDWRNETDGHLFLEELARELSPRTRGILRLRMAGYDWNWIARIAHMSSTNLRASFWRDVRRAHLRLLQSGKGTRSREW